MANPVYFPILRAKAGEIEAIGRLAPRTQSLVRPVLDFPKQKAKDKRPLADYLAEKAWEIKLSWGTGKEIYLDFLRYEPDTKVHDGRHIADYVFDLARQARLRTIPVAGPLSVRGPGVEYLDAVSRIAALDNRGVGLRLSYEYFSELSALQRKLEETLALLGVAPQHVDLFLDANSLALVPEEFRDELSLANTLRDAALATRVMGYRRIIFSGSNMPDSMTRHNKGDVMRVTRTEFRTWRRVHVDPDLDFLRFGDYAIAPPGQDQPEGRVIPPSRVRVTTNDEYVLYKGARDEIRKLSQSAIADGLLTGLSWGEYAIRECAAGYGSPGAAKQWVARDTNMHIERTVNAIAPYTADFPEPELPEGERGGPWLQESLDFVIPPKG